MAPGPAGPLAPAFDRDRHGSPERGIGFRSRTEQIDTTTPGGKLIFHVFGALAELERDLIRERTHASLAATRARRLYQDGETDIATICATLGISRATLYRALKADPTQHADG